MNIWLLQTGEPLPLNDNVRKLRTGLLSAELAGRGHHVLWWTSAFEHQRKVMLFDKDQTVILSNELSLQILKGCGYKRNVSAQRYLDHRIVAWKFRRQAVQLTPPDVIVTSLPCHHLSYEAVRYARLMNVPLIVDVRDLWPDIFLNGLGHGLGKKLGGLFLVSDFARLRTLMRSADALVAVSNGYLQWALDKAERRAGTWDRCFFLGYRRGEMNGNALQVDDLPRWLKGREGQKLLIYLGTFGASYELGLLVKAARKMHNEKRDDVCFVIAGTGGQEEMLLKEAAGLPNVVFPGWIDTDEIRKLLSKGYLGLVPCRSAEDTLPNKPFEYLSSDLPLVSSLEGEMAQLIDHHELGVNYQPGNLEGLCHAMEELLDNPTLRDKMSANARNFFNDFGDADKIYPDYADYIEELVLSRKGENSHSLPPV